MERTGEAKKTVLIRLLIFEYKKAALIKLVRLF